MVFTAVRTIIKQKTIMSQLQSLPDDTVEEILTGGKKMLPLYLASDVKSIKCFAKLLLKFLKNSK